jgi:proline iminopeptidase
MEYALKYQQNLKGLIVSNMMASAPEYGKYAAEVLAKQMDAKVLAEVRTIEKNQDFSNPRYMELLMPHFYKQHICRLAQWPAPLDSAFKHANGEIYTMMQGPSEFGISGRLARWDVKSRLHEIAVPTLMIGAKFDTMDPKAMAWQAKAVKNGQFFFVRTAVTYPCGTIKPFSWVELSSSFAAPRGRLTDEKCVDLHF